MRVRLQEVANLWANEIPALRDVPPESLYNQESLRAQSTGVCTEAVATYELHTEVVLKR